MARHAHEKLANAITEIEIRATDAMDAPICPPKCFAEFAQIADGELIVESTD